MLIPRAKIEEFCRKNSIEGIADFLASILVNSQTFLSFLESSGTTIISNPPVSILFHGSQKDPDYLGSSFSINQANTKREESLVYATDNPNYTIFLAIIDLVERGHASVLVEDGKTSLSVDRGFVNGGSQIKDGYVHVVDGAGFKPSDNDEYVSSQPARILFSIKVRPSDLTEKIWIKTDKP